MLVILPDYSLHYIKFIIPFIIITPNAHTFAINNPVANVPNVYFTIKSVLILLLVLIFIYISNIHKYTNPIWLLQIYLQLLLNVYT